MNIPTALNETLVTDNTCKIAAILANIKNCDYYISQGASVKAMKEFLRIAVDCYGADFIIQTLADFGDKDAKRYIKVIEKIAREKK